MKQISTPFIHLTKNPFALLFFFLVETILVSTIEIIKRNDQINTKKEQRMDINQKIEKKK